MANEEEEKKPNIVSGILNDLAMGLGLRERDQSYYDRTAQTIRNNQGQAAGDRYAARMQSQGFPAYGGPIGFLSGGRGIQGPRDFFDGGGLGQSGDRFVGGPYSMLANALGIKPMGYYDRARIGQRGGAGALAALQAGTVPTNTITTPAPTGNGQPETTFEEDLSGVEMYDFQQPMPMDLLTAMASGAIDAGVNPAPMLSTPYVYDPFDEFKLRRR